MECKEVNRIIKYRYVIPSDVNSQIIMHVRDCPACRNLIALDRLTFALIEARRPSDCEIDQDASKAFWVNKVKNRIREMREQHYSSWELALTTMRGWLAAFAAAAIILIAVSVQWHPPTVASDLDHEGEELNIQNPGEYLISDVPDPIDEDNHYAHK